MCPKHLYNRWLLIASLWLFGIPLLWGDESEDELWAFEGRISSGPEHLRYALKPGWVLSGSFFANGGLEPGLSDGAGNQEWTGGIQNTELTVDLYHLVQFEGQQRSGPAGGKITREAPDLNGQTSFYVYIPMEGTLELEEDGEETYLRWLQIWLFTKESRFPEVSRDLFLEDKLSWDSGWFRLAFSKEESGRDPDYLEGEMTVFGPLDEGEPQDRIDHLQSIVSGLGAQLMERDQRISELESEVERLRERTHGLRNLVDNLLMERQQIVAENDKLEIRAGDPDEALQQQLVQSESRQILLEEKLNSAEARNDKLSDSMGDLHVERKKLLDELEYLERQLRLERKHSARLKEQNSGSNESSEERESIIVIEESPPVLQKAEPPPKAKDFQQESRSSHHSPRRGPRSRHR